MAQAFMLRGRKTRRGPGSPPARRLRAVLQSPLAETHSAPAASEGPCDLRGEGVWRQYRTGGPSQTLTSAWRTDGCRGRWPATP
jgi:hypothetical protein